MLISRCYLYTSHDVASPDKPSAPQNLKVVEVFKDFITVVWSAPLTDGGSPITGYTVEKADATRRNFVNAGSTDAATLKFKVGKLSEGKEYLIRVFAENAIGQSDPVTLSDPVTAKLPFGESTAATHADELANLQLDLSFSCSKCYALNGQFISLLLSYGRQNWEISEVLLFVSIIALNDVRITDSVRGKQLCLF